MLEKTIKMTMRMTWRMAGRVKTTMPMSLPLTRSPWIVMRNMMTIGRHLDLVAGFVRRYIFVQISSPIRLVIYVSYSLEKIIAKRGLNIKKIV